jgi:predicted nucleic acid-binding protein
MKVFLDTNVLVAAVVRRHVNHEQAFAALERVQEGDDQGFASGHSLAEVYAVLTKSPPPFRHTPEQALLSIEENVVKNFKLSTLTGSEYAALIREAALGGIQGGTIYDAVLLKCAEKAEVEKICTFNVKHFELVAPREFRINISAP